jgi:hypothetical protein
MEVLLGVRQLDVAVELVIVVLATVELTLEEVSLPGGLEELWLLVVGLEQVLEVSEPGLGWILLLLLVEVEYLELATMASSLLAQAWCRHVLVVLLPLAVASILAHYVLLILVVVSQQGYLTVH